MNVPAKAKIAFKLLFAVLGFSSIVLEIVVLSQRGVFVPQNFFSYFTILSNLLAAVSLTVAAVIAMRRRSVRALDYLRGAATLFMTITGVVFALLLSQYDSRLLTALPWNNLVLHYIIPIAMVIDWVSDPPKRPLRLRYVLSFVGIPLLYLGYSMVRGALTGWYPYPFLNPAVGGYLAVAQYAVFIALFVFAAIVALVKLQPRPKV